MLKILIILSIFKVLLFANQYDDYASYDDCKWCFSEYMDDGGGSSEQYDWCLQHCQQYIGVEQTADD